MRVNKNHINEGKSVKAWAKLMLKEIHTILKQNNIPSKDYAVLGHVEISPFIRFTVKNEDVDKVLELFPMAEPDTTYYKNNAVINIEYKGLKEIEKQLKDSTNESVLNKLEKAINEATEATGVALIKKIGFDSVFKGPKYKTVFTLK